MELKHVLGYFPYKLELQYMDCQSLRKRKAYLTSMSIDEIETTYKRKIKGCSGDLIAWKGHNNVLEMKVKPILRPLSDLTKEIEVNGVTFEPAYFFEITDDSDSYCYEFDSGNIKLIKLLESISKHNIHFDIKFLPNIVVEKLYEWHFDIHGLIEKGLAINVNTLKHD